jgi:DNA polymerase-1
MSETKYPLYLFDGNNLAFRAFCGYPTLSTAEGLPIGGVYGVTRILTTFFKKWMLGKVLMPFDVGKSEYRIGIYPEYKGKRKSTPKQQREHERFHEQFKMIQDMVEAFGIKTIKEPGFEADDLIAYICMLFKQGAFPNVSRVVILSSDKDLCALIGPNVVWYDPIKSNLINEKNFIQQFGVEIHQYADFKALKGDSSDNIPHPPGVGEKNAVKLLQEYGTVDRLVGIQHDKISGHEEVLAIARKLIRLDLWNEFPNSPVWKRTHDAVKTPTQLSPDLKAFLEVLQFNSILEEYDEQVQVWEAFTQVSISSPLDTWDQEPKTESNCTPLPAKNTSELTTPSMLSL